MMRNEPLQPVMVEQPFRLTREEQEFVRKCLNTQLWSNELPYSFGAGFFTKVLMNFGYIKQSKTTIFSAVLGAFVITRAVSYSKCFQQLVQQPGNTVAERMNMRKRIIQGQQLEKNPNLLYPAQPDAGYSQPNYLDVDIERPDYPGIDPSVANPNAEAVPPTRQGQSYSELRQLNREAYQQQFRTLKPSPPQPRSDLPPSSDPPPSFNPSSSPYETPSYSFDPSIGSYDRQASMHDRPTPSFDRSENPPYEPPSPSRRPRTNKYGDILE